MKTYLPLLFLSFMVAFSGCKKNNPDPETPKEDLTQLPPETQEGKNTFGCLVNGKVWRNLGQVPFGPRDLDASYHNKTFFVSAAKETKKDLQGIGIHIYKVFTGKETYNLDNKKYSAVVFNDFNNNCIYDNLNYTSGILEITHFDSVNYIVAGRFNFTIAKSGCDTIRVTDGRFDIKYAY